MQPFARSNYLSICAPPSPRLVRHISIHVYKHVIHAPLSPAVLGVTVPLAVADGGIAHVRKSEVTPLASERQAAAALSSELIDQRLFLSILVAEDIWAGFTVMPLIPAGDLPAPEDGSMKQREDSAVARADHVKRPSRALPSAGLVQMLLPNRAANHLVFVAGDIGLWPFVNQIENGKNVDLALCLAQILCKQPAYVLGERDAKLGSPRLRPPPHFWIDPGLDPHAHGGMICAIPSSKQVIMRETRPARALPAARPYRARAGCRWLRCGR